MRFNLFRQSDIPPEYRSNFLHLYMDIAWFGVLSGTSVTFLVIYVTRLGASGFQVGLLNGIAAVVSLFLAIPAGNWLARRHTGHAVFWSSVLFRLGYFLWVIIPWLFDEQGQIWALILINFLMAIPLTPLGVGFNALFAEAVPSEYRAHVAGARNATFSISFMFTSLISGYILEHSSFPAGYQIVFLMGAIGAAVSSYHIFHIKPLQMESAAQPQPQPDSTPRANSSLKQIAAKLRLDIWATPFRNVLLVLFGFHLMQYLAAPLFPIYYVRGLHLTDNEIGIGTALFYFTVLIGSTQLRRLVNRVGHKTATGLGVMAMAFYPFGLAISSNVLHFYIVLFIAGFLFSVSSGSYANYLLDKTPPQDRPAHLAWYNIILNIAVLSGSLAGPTLADQIGLATALLIFSGFRFLSGVAILKWG